MLATIASTSVPPRDLGAARANAEACARKHPQWKETKRKEGGAFVFVLAPGSNKLVLEGCVATNAGAIDLNFSGVFATDRDVDGDGQPDAVLTKWVEAGRLEEGIEPVVVADRPGGPVVVPLEGYDARGRWQTIGWAEQGSATIELRIIAAEPFNRQTLGWNGRSIASREDTFLRASCFELPHTNGSQCELLGAGGGHAFALGLALGEPVNIDQIVEFRQDFAGDGSRFDTIGWMTAQSAGETDFEPERDDITLHLGKDGWEPTNLPVSAHFSVQDRDGDGRLEVDTSGGQVQLRDCPRGARACTPLEGSGDALMMWDGSRFSGSTARLAGAYAKGTPQVVDGLCPNDLVGPAGFVYLKARWAGASEGEALDRAGQVIARGSERACKPVGSVRPFALYRGELAFSLNDFLPESATKAKKPTRR